MSVNVKVLAVAGAAVAGLGGLAYWRRRKEEQAKIGMLVQALDKARAIEASLQSEGRENEATVIRMLRAQAEKDPRAFVQQLESIGLDGLIASYTSPVK